MPEPIDQRVEKLKTELEGVRQELAVLRQDYMFICALVGVSIAFVKNLHQVVDLSENAATKLLDGWTTEVNKRDTISDLFEDIKRKLGGSDGPAAH